MWLVCMTSDRASNGRASSCSCFCVAAHANGSEADVRAGYLDSRDLCHVLKVHKYMY